jgi:hypothetical protein
MTKVNGGQTTHALFDAYLNEPKKLQDVLLLLRICETRDRDITDKISETTNSQTPVKGRDIHANDAIQRDLDTQFKDRGYYYERKKNMYEEMPKNSRLNNELLGQIYLSYYLDMASEAKNEKTIIFGDMCDKIFDSTTITADMMLVPYRIFLPLEKIKKDIKGKKRKKRQQMNRKTLFQGHYFIF